jgi:hypothetical protein
MQRRIELLLRHGLMLTSLGCFAHTALAADPQFLTRRTPSQYLGENNAVAEQETAAYYNAWGAPSTLAEFRRQWQFDAVPNRTAGAIFYNAHELGIGRIMRCVKGTGENRACYVDNYGSFGGWPNDAIEDMAHRTNVIATVAMTFVPARGSSAVNFVAYDANGRQAYAAKLDQKGDSTSIPFNCTNCHGGTYDPATHTLTGAQFLGFDLDTFYYAQYQGYGRNDQEDQFRQLNEHVLAIASLLGNTKVVDLINGWYHGKVHTPYMPFDGSYVPSGWANAADVYRKTVAPHCRSCHSTNSGFDILSSANMAAAMGSDLCSAKLMPNAQQMLNSFWSDFDAQDAAEAFTGVSCHTPP